MCTKLPYILTCLIPSLRISAITAHIPYIVPILDSFTGKSGTIPRVRSFGRERVLERLNSHAGRKDLFYHLVSEYIESDVQLPEADYRVVRDSLKRSVPLSMLLHRMGA